MGEAREGDKMNKSQYIIHTHENVTSKLITMDNMYDQYMLMKQK